MLGRCERSFGVFLVSASSPGATLRSIVDSVSGSAWSIESVLMGEETVAGSSS
jgi:hypothetical protein